MDSTREISPLIKTADAVEVDVTFINKEEQFDTLYKLAMERINKVAKEY